jgi:hypothetical protein
MIFHEGMGMYCSYGNNNKMKKEKYELQHGIGKLMFINNGES